MAIYNTNSSANNYGKTVYMPGAFAAHNTGTDIPQPDYSGDNSKYLTRYQGYAGARSLIDSFNYGTIYNVSKSFTAVSGIEFSHTGNDHANFLSDTPESYDGRALDVSIRWYAESSSLSGVIWGVRTVPYSSTVPDIEVTGLNSMTNYTTGIFVNGDDGAYTTSQIQIPSASLTGMGADQNFVFSLARFSQSGEDDLNETTFVKDVNVYKAGHPTYG